MWTTPESSLWDWGAVAAPSFPQPVTASIIATRTACHQETRDLPGRSVEGMELLVPLMTGWLRECRAAGSWPAR